MKLRNVIGAFVLAWSASYAAGTQLYPDSTIVVQDRFSDEITGTGPDLVFIPGLSSPRAVWKAAADRLRTKHRLHLIQVAGFAGEPARANASGPVLIPTAEAIDAYLEAHKLAPAVVIGHSLGGTMALYLAEKHPGHFKKVMLVDALPFYPVIMGGPSAKPEAFKAMADGMRNSPAPMTLSEQAATWMASAPADRATIIAWSADSDSSAVRNATADDMELDLRPGLAAVGVPVTLVFPDYSPVGRTGTTAFYAGEYATLKGVKLVEIGKSVHFVMFDQPAQFEAALDKFLED